MKGGHMLTRYVTSFYSNLFLNAAEELNLNHEIIDEERDLIRIYSKGKDFLIIDCTTQFNNAIGRIFAKNKNLTSKYLRRHQLPAPQFKLFKDFNKALKHAVSCNQHIVIKPSNASLAKGITVKPKGEDQIRKALEGAFQVSETVMVEDFIKGKDYRITVFNDKVIAVTYRAPGHVVGNGKDTVKKLIADKNEKRESLEKPLITLREKDLDFLYNRDLDLNYIPEEGEFVRLQLGCDRDIGGDRHRIEIREIHPDNIALFKKVAKTLKLRYCGIDFISPDITKSHKEIKCGINEVNSAPHQDVHYFDTPRGDNYSCRRILKTFFELA